MYIFIHNYLSPCTTGVASDNVSLKKCVGDTENDGDTQFDVTPDSKRYLTIPDLQVQSNSQVTGIPLNGRQRLKLKHWSMSLRLFNLPLGHSVREAHHFKWSSEPLFVCLYLGLNSRLLCS